MKFSTINLTFDGGEGGGGADSAFLKIIFTAKTRHYQGSRGHQVRRQPCKFVSLTWPKQIFRDAFSVQVFEFTETFI